MHCVPLSAASKWPKTVIPHLKKRNEKTKTEAETQQSVICAQNTSQYFDFIYF